MKVNLILAAGLYLTAGRFCWRRIVIPGPDAAQPERWRKELADAEAHADIAYLIVKAAFVLFWPLALGHGWLAGLRGREP